MQATKSSMRKTKVRTNLSFSTISIFIQLCDVLRLVAVGIVAFEGCTYLGPVPGFRLTGTLFAAWGNLPFSSLVLPSVLDHWRQEYNCSHIGNALSGWPDVRNYLTWAESKYWPCSSVHPMTIWEFRYNSWFWDLCRNRVVSFLLRVSR